MTDYKPQIPTIDDTVRPSELHQRCEQVAVPNFDWMSQPIVAVVEGLLHRDRSKVPKPTTDTPGQPPASTRPGHGTPDGK
jgi:hypothetical protein